MREARRQQQGHVHAVEQQIQRAALAGLACGHRGDLRHIHSSATGHGT
jgi:hypothetical protein